MSLTAPKRLLAAVLCAMAVPVRSARIRFPSIAIGLVLALAMACNGGDGGEGGDPAAAPVVDEAEIRRIVREATADVPTTAEIEFQIDEATADLPTMTDIQSLISEAIGGLAAPPTMAEMESLIADALAGLEDPPTDDEFRQMIADAVADALPPKVVAHSAEISVDNSLIAEVSVSLSREASVFVEYDNPRAGRFRTALSGPGMSHSIPVVRLLPGADYTYTVGIQGEDGAVTIGASGEFVTGLLPAEIADLETTVSGRSTQPLILADYGIGANSYYVFRDEVGNIVWYYADGAGDGGDAPEGYTGGIRQKADGNLVYLSNGCCVTEITPLGEVVSRVEAGGDAGVPYGDFVVMGDGRVLYPSDTHIVFNDSANGGDEVTAVVIDTMRIWDPENGGVEQAWDPRDFWDIADPAERVIWSSEPGYRWTEVNSVSIGPRGNFVLSLGDRQQVISLSHDFQSVEWRIGGPGSDYDFPDPGNRFYGPHAASELSNGNILVFDSGAGRSVYEGGEYSRALELRLDAESGGTVKAWEYRFDPDILSVGVSGASRLINGNTLVNFGATANPAFIPLTLVEADVLGREVFRVEVFQPDNASGSIRSFRAHGDIGTIMGETMLRPPAARVEGELRISGDDQYWPAAEVDARLGGLQLAASEVFDVYIDGNLLAYRKEQCSAADTEADFLVHVYPVDPADLSAERVDGGYSFNNLDFRFQERGALWGGKCLAITALPEYPIARIRTGQYNNSGQNIPEERLWRTDIYMDQLPRINELDARLGQGRFVGGELYDVYLSGDRMIYFRDSCDEADTEARFFVHVVPVDLADLPADREGSSFDNLDFSFLEQGARQGRRCLAMVTLPDYPVERVRTGQFIRGEEGSERLWQVEFSVGR